ncbi:DUF4157 domain-containing protein [Ferrimicrobium sp.]|uniref:eCIS core domain-containing protein n=1 Tax=Ferrimicrobium sp. TaxID=2926050 RepID=UPI002608DE45|nr:DUF4157 domain-containing protein [Ferrimicrobium sp.]
MMPATIAQGVDQRFRWHRRLVRRPLPNIGKCLNGSVRFSSLIGRPLSVHALLTPARSVDVSQVPEVVRTPWHPYLSMWRSRGDTDDHLAQELAGARFAGRLPRVTQMPHGQFAPTSGLRRLRQEVLPVRLPADVAAVGPILTDRERKFVLGSRAPERTSSLPRPTAPQLKPVATQLSAKMEDHGRVVRPAPEQSDSLGSGGRPQGSSGRGAVSSAEDVSAPARSSGLGNLSEATPFNHESASSKEVSEPTAQRTAPAGSSASEPGLQPRYGPSNALRDGMQAQAQAAFTLAEPSGYDLTERSGTGNPLRPDGGGAFLAQPSATDLLAVSFMLLEALGTSFKPALLARRGVEHVAESGPFWQYTNRFPRTRFTKSGSEALATVQRRLQMAPGAIPDSRGAVPVRAFSTAGAPVALPSTARAGYHAMSRPTSPAVGPPDARVGWGAHHGDGHESPSFPHAGDIGGGGRRSLTLALAAWKSGSSPATTRSSSRRQGPDVNSWAHRRGLPWDLGRQKTQATSEAYPTHEDLVPMNSLASGYRLEHALRQFRVSAPSRGIFRSALMMSRFYSPVGQGSSVAGLRHEFVRSALGIGEAVHPRGAPVDGFAPRQYRLRRSMDMQADLQQEHGSSSGSASRHRFDNRHDGGENRRTTRQRFVQALGAQPRDSLRPLPARFRPLAQALGVVRPVHIRTGDSTRQALQQVGQAGATYRGVIHLQKEPDGSPASVGVLAHELVHARVGQAAEPRFFRDRKVDSEEIMARRVGTLASKLTGESASIKASSGLSQALLTTKTASRLPPASRVDSGRPALDRSMEPGGQRRSGDADAGTAPSQSFEKLLKYFRDMEHPRSDVSAGNDGEIGVVSKPASAPNNPHSLPSIVRDVRGGFNANNSDSGRSYPRIVDKGVLDVKNEDDPLVGSSSAPQAEEFLDWLVEQVERRLLRESEARGQRHMPEVL